MRKRMLGVLATAAAFAGVVGAAATPAAAVWPWITGDQILSITDRKTAVSKVTSVGTIEVRYGTYEGRQYGWGRVVNPAAGYNLIFEVDLNGDRIRDDRDDWSVNLSLPEGGTHWTAGYATSSSSARAFRACLTKQYSYSCAGTTNRTAWW